MLSVAAMVESVGSAPAALDPTYAISTATSPWHETEADVDRLKARSAGDYSAELRRAA